MQDLQKAVQSEKIATRGLKSQEEVAQVMTWIKGSDASLSVPAAKALIKVINTPDDGQKGEITSRRCCELLTNKTDGCLEALLDVAMKNQLPLHNDIKKAELKIGEVIGKGKAGSVHQGTYQGKSVAIKCFNNSDKIDDKEFQKELSIMSVIRSERYVLVCYGGSAKKGNKFIVTELMETSVYDLLHEKTVEINDQMAFIMAIQIAKCVAYLHDCDIIHRDLKSLNLLVSKFFEIKICDFGLSRVIDKNAPMTSSVGTVAWVAPEIINQTKKQYTEKADIYSYGVILWELITREMPFADLEAFAIPIQVTKGKRPSPVPKAFNKEYRKLMKKCWGPKFSARPDANSIVTQLESAYVKQMAKSKDWLTEPFAYNLDKKGDTLSVSIENNPKNHPAHAIWNAKKK
eukprot:TRINITY_DN10350_c0_g1_i1.p1 TRINITY_DN10350_c0_g1~~TRINITY_DN10350_c0_g1_i1.p1  ORF type:complete len:403 (-),score=83.51 TRINITY_DN10350_c0_g1_i1:29-1237(-)